MSRTLLSRAVSRPSVAVAPDSGRQTSRVAQPASSVSSEEDISPGRNGAGPGQECEPGQVLCDQAVFTSVRSGNGEGYRIIAASPGVQAAERVEITRRSPSHGGLCAEDDPQAVGLESYALPSKRHCIAYCCHAGSEHTARGGQRVYTHAILLDRQGWRAFQANPVAVHAALAQHVEATGPILKAALRLEKLALTVPATMGNAAGIGQATSTDTVDWALSIAGDVLAGRQLVLLNSSSPFRLLEKVALSLPLETRERLDASVDVKFSPARRMRLVFTTEAPGELERRIGALPIQLRQVGKAPEQTSGAAVFDAWERLLRRWWREGRRQDIQRLTAELCRGVSSDALDRVAMICEQTDAVDTLPAEALRDLLARYGGGSAATKAEQVLIGELVEKVNQRLTRMG